MGGGWSEIAKNALVYRKRGVGELGMPGLRIRVVKDRHRALLDKNIQTMGCRTVGGTLAYPELQAFVP
jgi:hypothetical protein